MKKIELNSYQNIFYFVWDGLDSTIDLVNEYLKTTKGNNWSCGRCWNDTTQSNSSDTIFITVKKGTIKNNSFYRNGEYVVDFVNCFRGLKKEEFDKQDFIERWKQHCKYEI